MFYLYQKNILIGIADLIFFRIHNDHQFYNLRYLPTFSSN